MEATGMYNPRQDNQTDQSSDNDVNRPRAERRTLRRYRRASQRIRIPASENSHLPNKQENCGAAVDKHSESDGQGAAISNVESDIPTCVEHLKYDIKFLGSTSEQTPPEPERNINAYSNNICGTRSKEELEDNVFEMPVIRAKSARELVRSQEHLVNMLQAMKTDISRMDREASRIKEDVVRSNQLFDIVVKMKEAHHLPLARDGYNIKFSIPRVSYPIHSHRDSPGTLRFLNQLSTFRRESASTSRRSSMSSSYSDACGVSARHIRSIRDTLVRTGLSRTSSRSSVNMSSNGDYSGTESDMDSTASRSHDWSHAYSESTQSRDSDSTCDGADSSTESVATHRRDKPRTRLAARNADRRSSYFYTTRSGTASEANSEEVDL